MPKVAVVLSGCGHQDGAEIREAVLTLLYLDEQGADVEIFAPDIPQRRVANHLTGQDMKESRNVLAESARIARGKIADLTKLDPAKFDALILPGGYGAALNLSDFALKGKDAEVLPDLKRVIEGFSKTEKPIGAICISPAVLAAALKGKGLVLTIGSDKATAGAIEALGHQHKNSAAAGAVADEAHRVASCPAYMTDAPLREIAQGIRGVVEQVLAMSRRNKKAA